MRSSLSSLSISSSMAAWRSPILLKASLRSACRLWLAASRLSMSISCRWDDSQLTWTEAWPRTQNRPSPPPYQLVLLAAGLPFLFSQFSHLLLDVADLSLETFVLLLLSVLAAAPLVSLLRQLLHVLLKTGHQALRGRREGSIRFYLT